MINFDEDRLVWKQLYEELRRRIEEGIYKERMPIPSAPRLVDEFGVALNTARRAVKQLKDEGFVNSINGKGTYVRPRDAWNPGG